MQVLFAPAVALMNRLRYPAKFLLLGAALSAVMLMLLFSVFKGLNRDIEIAEHELAGVRVLKPLNRAAQALQKHRGLSAGILGGNDAMKEARIAQEKAAQEALEATANELPAALRDSASWKKILGDWEQLRAQGMTWSVADNVKAHTALIDQTLLLMVEVADATELTLDPAMDTYYMMDTIVLKMPAMLERLGQTRARGTGVLAKKEIPPQMKVDMTSTLAEMSGTLRAQNINLTKVIRFAPNLQGALNGAGKDFSDNLGKFMNIVREDILSERFSTPPQEYFNMATAIIDAGYKTMYDVLIVEFEQQLKDRRDASQRALVGYLILTAVVLLLVAYLGIGTYYSVLDTVSDFSQGARRLAGGDLTTQFDGKGADELHAAGRDFNDMAAAFRKLLGGVQGDIRKLDMAAGQLASSSHQISAGTASQSDAASSMAAAVEQMTVGVDHIAKNAQDAQTYSRQSDSVAAHSGQIVQAVVDEIQGIAQTVNQSAVAVEALGQQSEQISAIVGTIKDIADQTNLLALNAAIEAARAGESGRGFAVVADEVRKLAERTAKSTQEISAMIGSIQTGTATAVSSMKQGVDRVAAGVEQARLAGEAITQVQTQSRQVLEAVSEISVALREQAAASTEIAQNVERIAQMAEENNAAAGSNTETADTLRSLANGLTSAIARFRT